MKIMLEDDFKNRFLNFIDDHRTMDDDDMESIAWYSDWHEQAPILEVVLYVLEKQILEDDFDHFLKDVPKSYLEQIEKKRISITTEFMNTKSIVIDERDIESEIKNILGADADLFITGTNKYRLKTIQEAQQVKYILINLRNRYPHLSNNSDVLRENKKHGSDKSKGDVSIHELKKLLFNLISEQFKIDGKRRNETTIKRIISTLTSH